MFGVICQIGLLPVRPDARFYVVECLAIYNKKICSMAKIAKIGSKHAKFQMDLIKLPNAFKNFPLIGVI